MTKPIPETTHRLPKALAAVRRIGIRRKAMKILVLEDSQERIEKFKTLFPEHDHDVWFTYEAQECIDLLDTQQWDILFLDHDLGGDVYVQSGKGTGYELAGYIAESINKDTAVIIHSCNHAGATQISFLLPCAVRVPFVSLNIEAALIWAEEYHQNPNEEPV